MKKWIAVLIGVVLMIFALNSNVLTYPYQTEGGILPSAYDADGNLIYNVPVPNGTLNASQQIVLPDIYSNGHGWTCAGLAYDAVSDTFLVGDIGKALPSSSGFASQIVRVSRDFSAVINTIPLYTSFPNMQDVQGITIDTTDGTIWFCSTSESLIRHIDTNGNSLGSFSTSAQPTGIAYSPIDDCFWVLTYASSNNILKVSKAGTVLETYSFAYSATLDQCFLDPSRGLLYITAGADYTNRNNIYLFNTQTHEQSIACTVDSYSVEGLWLGDNQMVIVNDGFYHSAHVPENQANIYTISAQ